VRRENLGMGFHHVALATNDTEATHRFYSEVMGFELVKVVAAGTPNPGDGYSKHFFYSTEPAETANGSAGDHGMIAFWEIHDPEIGTDYGVDLNKSAGLPWWVNHIAFDAPTRESLDAHRRRWQEHGQTVLEVDHEFCVSIYIRDPSGNMVEFCHTTRAFTAQEKITALALLNDPRPDLDKEYSAIIHQPVATPVT
jgi:catechol 2,3-dioxygenase-like lactoylglutathione lyase family enzyme